MCGIVGLVVSGQFGPLKSEEDTFFDMLYCDALRGEDATGTVLIEKDSAFSIMKDAWPSWYTGSEIRASPLGKQMFARGVAYIGHNRKATIGARTSETAHPFVVDDTFALVHNGTLRNHKQLAQTDVDSQALAIHLKPHLTNGFHKEAFEEAIGKVEGAYAVVCYDQEKHQIYMFRNSERPLALLETAGAILFGSEFGLLQWCAARNNMSLKDAKSEYLATNTMYTIDLDTRKVTKEEYVPKKAITPSTPTHSVVPWTGKTTTATTDDSTRLSKNEFKRLRKMLLGQRLRFWADDFVEANYPQKFSKSNSTIKLMGTYADAASTIPVENDNHFIQGDFDARNLEEEDILNRLYIGKVTELAYNRDTGSVTIYVDEVKVLPKSLSKKDEAETVVH